MERVFHTWDQWECYPAGFYENKAPTTLCVTDDECRTLYAEFLRDTPRFNTAMTRVLAEWPNSTEHYLSNDRMNRIAWLGQAAACIDMALPRVYRGGFNQLSPDEQETANLAALDALNTWLTSRGEPVIATLAEAQSRTEMDLY